MPGLENIILVGASGRMGRCIQALAEEEGLSVQACATRPRLRLPEIQLPQTSVLMDFSHEAVTHSLLEDFLEKTSPAPPLLVGTTGLSPETVRNLRSYAERRACLLASNFSLGVALLRACVRLLAAKLPASFGTEIIEIHHRHKRDRPSGTAQLLRQELQRARGERNKPKNSQNQNFSDIGLHSLRLGSFAGEHQVIFADEGENLRLIHQTENRQIFARGALHAARWILGKKPGLYSLEDVFEL
ncbi:MAG: 4-hydroxy-tetrahydrodipicolinate reductase [Puniceicoccales bacterium]|jgi:4-hydroxy-tetrahydrodipicolinate reductase|nr:4-hydroxy-tetrahydrodipicolinate reductase [Puniceicoccales bacterium]